MKQVVICDSQCLITYTFHKCRYFNSLQSECFSPCFLSDINMVISAPTGSGKTVLFELCILRLLSRFISEEGRFIHVKGTLKTVSLLNNDPNTVSRFPLLYTKKSLMHLPFLMKALTKAYCHFSNMSCLTQLPTYNNPFSFPSCL